MGPHRVISDYWLVGWKIIILAHGTSLKMLRSSLEYIQNRVMAHSSSSHLIHHSSLTASKVFMSGSTKFYLITPQCFHSVWLFFSKWVFHFSNTSACTTSAFVYCTTMRNNSHSSKPVSSFVSPYSSMAWDKLKRYLPNFTVSEIPTILDASS
jgi:hypothetical protein